MNIKQKSMLVTAVVLGCVSIHTHKVDAGEVSVTNSYSNTNGYGNTRLKINNTESHLGREWSSAYTDKVSNEVNISADNYRERNYSDGSYSYSDGYAYLNAYLSPDYYGYGNNPYSNDYRDNLTGSVSGSIYLNTYYSPTSSTSTKDGSLNVSETRISSGSRTGSSGSYSSNSSVFGQTNSYFDSNSFETKTTSSASNF